VNSPWWANLVLAVLLASMSFLLQRSSGINLADEGFLWYGVQQTVDGAVPTRDFQSYDPGRYYWSAGWALVFGRGLVALRLSEISFQAIGLFVGLLLASRISHGWGFLLAVGVMFLLWMFPIHKLFDHTVLLCGIWVAVRLIEQPSPGRIFAAGLFVGLSAFFGRNHGLYNFLAQAALLVYVAWKSRLLLSFPELATWVGGIVVGLLPIVALLVFSSGFGARYFESIGSILHSGTNLTIPIPWPWRSSPSDGVFSATQCVVGLLLIVVPISYAAALACSLSMRAQIVPEHAVFIACAFVGPFYLHHAFSRADVSHVAQAIHPFLLGMLAVPCALAASACYRWSVTAILIGVALGSVVPQTATFQRFTARAPWKAVDLGGKIFVPPALGRAIVCLQEFTAENIPRQDAILAAPYVPGLYPILKRRSALWDLAFLFPSTDEKQNQMMRRLDEQNVRWAIISEPPELRLSSTHRLLWEYLTTNFEPVPISCLPSSIKVLHRKF
jgi:hypothetical protein